MHLLLLIPNIDCFVPSLGCLGVLGYENNPYSLKSLIFGDTQLSFTPFLLNIVTLFGRKGLLTLGVSKILPLGMGDHPSSSLGIKLVTFSKCFDWFIGLLSRGCCLRKYGD